MAKSPFVPVNELLERTTLQQFVTHYNFNTEIQQSGNEERIRSPFACEKCQGNGKALSVNWQSGVFISHCYHCNVRGRVTTLLFGMKYGRKPSGEKLKGEEFKDIAADIAKVAGFGSDLPQTDVPPKDAPPNPTESLKKPERKINIPLAKNPDPRIAALEHLSDEFVYDVTAMNARATTYLAKRAYMTSDIMKQWGVGQLASHSRSMLRGRLVYTLRNERSEKIGYVGRDLAFEDKLRKWENSDRTGKAPIKAKFPPGFARGSFLYGAEVSRLANDRTQEQLKDTGILIVEGMNDVIALDSHGITAVALCSNRIAECQIEKLVRWSKELANGRITLMLDNDKEGFEGAKDTIQKLSRHVFVRSVWGPESNGGKLRGMQPEQLTSASLLELFKAN